MIDISSIPAGVTLVAVSKYHSIEQIAAVYAKGCRDFGESRVQELKAKQAALPNDIRWHFIGHLQTNKVRDLLRMRPHLIQSVDSEHLLRAIDNEAAKQDIRQDILLELHVAAEQTKSGMSIDDYHQLLPAIHAMHYPNVRICGIMGMATNTDDEQETRRCFRTLRAVYEELLTTIPAAGHAAYSQHLHLSMGMSDDYHIALAEGSNMLRIGSAIFD